MLLVDKPQGCSSHDVVGRARRALGIRRVGHSGTLDPMATGLLVLAAGWATRLLRFTDSATKTYDAELTLGIETDTWDGEGEVVASAAVTASEARIREALAGLVGEIRQVPPMYAAIKVGGEKLYDKARRGEEVSREARPVTIHAIDDVAVDGPRVRFTVTCSAGTYVRSIAHDVGAALGCGGHLSRLRRTRIGTLGVDDARSLEALDEVGRTALVAPLALVSHLPRVEVDAAAAALVSTGRRVPGAGPGLVALVRSGTGELVAVYDQGRPVVTAPT